MDLISAVVLMFFVMDTVGNVPLFLTALERVDPRRRQRVIARELLIALVVMVAFLFLGGPMLAVLKVSREARLAAGGVILLLIAIRMIFPSPERSLTEPMGGEPFIVPLAIPYTAGPSLLPPSYSVLIAEARRASACLGHDRSQRPRGTPSGRPPIMASTLPHTTRAPQCRRSPDPDDKRQTRRSNRWTPAAAIYDHARRDCSGVSAAQP